MIIDEKNNVAATDFKENIDMIRYRFNEILKSLYSPSYREKDHLPSLDTIYKKVYINNRGFDDTLFRHITFPVFLSILIDTDINNLEDCQRETPIFNINRLHMDDFQSLELVRLWVEEIIYAYLHSTAWFTEDMLIDILKQFKNIYHGKYEYIIDFADQFIELKSKIYDLEEFKDLKLGQADRHIRYVSEEFSKFILSRSYRKSVRQFNDYMTSYNYINKIFDLSLDNEEKEQPITEYASCFDYDKSAEAEDSKADETDNITDIIAPADGIIKTHYSNYKIIQVRFDEEIDPKELSSDFIDNKPGKLFLLNYNKMPTIIDDKTKKNITFSILDQSTPSEIKTGYRFKKGDVLIKRSLSSEISQKEIDAIMKALTLPINSECKSISNELN